MSAIHFQSQFWSVRDLLLRSSQIKLDPEYQREGSIWSQSRRQLFVDTVLNGFDSPKLYLHDLIPPELLEDSFQKYAVIDGRQRLETLSAFANNEFPLSKEFRLLAEGSDDEEFDFALFESDSGGRFAGKYFRELEEGAPSLARQFLAYEIAVVLVETQDIGYIEELFFRLNEGSPLYPAEKRNRGQLWRGEINRIRNQPFFDRLRFPDVRGRYSDLILRMLFLESRKPSFESLPDMRLRLLDDFAAQFRPSVGTSYTGPEEDRVRKELQALEAPVGSTLERMASVFVDRDPLLRLSNDALTYYVVFRLEPELVIPGARDELLRFTASTKALEGIDEDDLTPDELTVLDVFGTVQGTTTGSYLASRARIVRDYLKGDLQLSDDLK